MATQIFQHSHIAPKVFYAVIFLSFIFLKLPQQGRSLISPARCRSPVTQQLPSWPGQWGWPGRCQNTKWRHVYNIQIFYHNPTMIISPYINMNKHSYIMNILCIFTGNRVYTYICAYSIHMYYTLLHHPIQPRVFARRFFFLPHPSRMIIESIEVKNPRRSCTPHPP